MATIEERDEVLRQNPNSRKEEVEAPKTWRWQDNSEVSTHPQRDADRGRMEERIGRDIIRATQEEVRRRGTPPQVDGAWDAKSDPPGQPSKCDFYKDCR